MLKQLLVTMALGLALAAPALAQDSTPEATAQGGTAIVPLPDLVGDEYRPQQSALSTDGKQIAWFGSADDGMCILTLATKATECTPVPEGAGRSAVNMAWSPDSKTIAYSDDFFIRFLEADIHVFDVASKTYRNLTDDQSDASPLDAGPNVPTDYLPTWSPDGSLYFWRSTKPASDITLALEKLSSVDGSAEPENLRDMTRAIPGPYAVYQQAAVSPDGSTMAIIVMQQKAEAPDNGIYTVNLKTQEVKLVATLTQLRTGLPQFVERPSAYPMAIYWAGQSGLVVNLYSQDYAAMEPPYAVYIALPANTVKPIFDFSGYKSRVELVNAMNGGEVAGTPIELAGGGIPTPDGTQYLFVHRTDQSTVAVSSLPLPPDGSAPTLLAKTGFTASPSARVNTISSDGKTALIFDYLVTLGG